APPVAPDCAHPGTATYVTPAPGAVTARTPLLRWEPIPRTAGYWVVVAKDPQFTNVIDVARTTDTAYAPPKTYRDETTAYYWAVVPSPDGACVSSQPIDHNPQAFQKQSIAPAPLAPGEGSDVADQPVFRWTPAEGAAAYKVQVDDDPTFADPIESTTTTSTAYATAKTYPADTVTYWRVRAIDLAGVELNWSPTATFRRRLAAP